MDPDKAKKLDALLRRRRWRGEIYWLAVIVFIVGLFGLVFLDSPSSQETVTGTVTNWSRAQSELGSGSYIVMARLDDGSEVTATGAASGRAPVIGSRVRLVRTRLALGRVRYRWLRDGRTQ